MRGLSLILLGLCLAAVSADPIYPKKTQKIVGGSLVTINQYPFGAPLLYSFNLISYSQACGGTIISNTAILSAGHCFVGDVASQWRVRVGSSYAHSGGVVHNVNRIVTHPSYWSVYNDVAVLRTQTVIAYNANVASAPIASTNYNLADNSAVVAIGWGRTAPNGAASEQLRAVQVWTVNQNTCSNRYAELGYPVYANMLCAGWLDVGGRDGCQGDSGGPLIHGTNVIVGITSWGESCALARYPGVYARVSSFTAWIQSAAA